MVVPRLRIISVGEVPPSRCAGVAPPSPCLKVEQFSSAGSSAPSKEQSQKLSPRRRARESASVRGVWGGGRESAQGWERGGRAYIIPRSLRESAMNRLIEIGDRAALDRGVESVWSAKWKSTHSCARARVVRRIHVEVARPSVCSL